MQTLKFSMSSLFKGGISSLLVKPAFLFDIDGCLTLPFNPDHPISILDKPLLQQIVHWYEDGIPIALVTGRSSFYLEEEFSQISFEYGFKLPIYIEFGLLKFQNTELMREDYCPEFNDERERFLTDFRDLAEKLGVHMVEGEHVQYPESGIWREKKHVMSSVISNHDTPPSTIHKIAKELMDRSSYSIRLLNHPLGIDVLPKDWSKRNPARTFSSNYQNGFEWYIFGDNKSDAEMAEVVPSSSFFSTREFGSKSVWGKLREITPKYNLHLLDIDHL